MNYQIYGDKLTVYLENSTLKQHEIKILVEKNEIEWIVLDCENVLELNSDMLGVLLECSSGLAEVIAINASVSVSKVLMMCFIDVSLGFNYVPNVNSMSLIFNIDDLNMDFIFDKIYEFLDEKEFKINDKRSLYASVNNAISDVQDKDHQIQKIEITSTILDAKIAIDVKNGLSGKNVRIEDEICADSEEVFDFLEFLNMEDSFEV